MAFIDWLRKQQQDSERFRQQFDKRPSVPASQAWSGYQDRPGGQRLMVRQMQRPEIDNTLTVKNDGTQTLVKKWKDPDQSNVKATALPPEPVMSPGRELRGYPTFDRDSFRTRGMGGFTGGAQRYDMGMDPGWSGVPQARAAPAPRRVQPRVSGPMNTRPGTVGGSLHHPASIVNLGPPRVEDLRNRVSEIGRQQAAIPRQQMPPPRHVPPVDWRNFPQVQNRHTGTYTLPPPQVELNRGEFSLPRALKNIPGDYTNWWDQNVRRQAAGDTSTIGGKIPQAFWDFYEENPTIHQAVGAGVKSGIWDPIKERMDKILEDIRKRREGQTMAPFDWRNN